jgi:hypothetical protein
LTECVQAGISAEIQEFLSKHATQHQQHPPQSHQADASTPSAQRMCNQPSRYHAFDQIHWDDIKHPAVRQFLDATTTICTQKKGSHTGEATASTMFDLTRGMMATAAKHMGTSGGDDESATRNNSNNDKEAKDQWVCLSLGQSNLCTAVALAYIHNNISRHTLIGILRMSANENSHCHQQLAKVVLEVEYARYSCLIGKLHPVVAPSPNTQQLPSLATKQSSLLVCVPWLDMLPGSVLDDIEYIHAGISEMRKNIASTKASAAPPNAPTDSVVQFATAAAASSTAAATPQATGRKSTIYQTPRTVNTNSSRLLSIASSASSSSSSATTTTKYVSAYGNNNNHHAGTTKASASTVRASTNINTSSKPAQAATLPAASAPTKSTDDIYPRLSFPHKLRTGTTTDSSLFNAIQRCFVLTGIVPMGLCAAYWCMYYLTRASSGGGNIEMGIKAIITELATHCTVDVSHGGHVAGGSDVIIPLFVNKLCHELIPRLKMAVRRYRDDRQMKSADESIVIVDPLKQLYDSIVQEVGELVVLRFIARFTY